jgi:hypothetical protein
LTSLQKLKSAKLLVVLTYSAPPDPDDCWNLLITAIITAKIVIIKTTPKMMNTLGIFPPNALTPEVMFAENSLVAFDSALPEVKNEEGLRTAIP